MGSISKLRKPQDFFSWSWPLVRATLCYHNACTPVYSSYFFEDLGGFVMLAKKMFIRGRQFIEYAIEIVLTVVCSMVLSHVESLQIYQEGHCKDGREKRSRRYHPLHEGHDGIDF